MHLLANLLAMHGELEALQLENKDAWDLFDGDPLCSWNFALLLGADVLVLALKALD